MSRARQAGATPEELIVELIDCYQDAFRAASGGATPSAEAALREVRRDLERALLVRHNARVTSGMRSRAHLRARRNTPIVVALENGPARATILDVGGGGFSALLPDTQTPPQRVRFAALLDYGPPLEGWSRLVWSRPIDGGGVHAGFAFEEMPPHDVERLSDYVIRVIIDAGDDG